MNDRADNFWESEIDDRRTGVDRRESPRRRILKGGRAFWPNGDSSECFVHTLSDTGAQLQFRGPCPTTFDLVIDDDDLRRPCSVVWRKDNRVGVQFSQPHPVALSAATTSKGAFSCRHYAQECRRLAERVNPSDREALLDMADAWETIVRKFQRKIAASRV
jgi:hypothetical protein